MYKHFHSTLLTQRIYNVLKNSVQRLNLYLGNQKKKNAQKYTLPKARKTVNKANGLAHRKKISFDFEIQSNRKLVLNSQNRNMRRK